eukprot:g4100.t1
MIYFLLSHVLLFLILTTLVIAKLPDIHLKGSIFFLHTSAESSISNIARCAIESAARSNPSRRVIVYSNGWKQDEVVGIHTNVYFSTYNVLDIFEGYPQFLNWYRSSLWKLGYPVNNLSNALRLVILHQSGGTYMDTDIISLKNLDTLAPNSIGVENMQQLGDDEIIVNSAVMANFETSNKYLDTLLTRFTNSFQGDRWGYNGPQLLSRTLRELHEKVSTWDARVFYPVHWKDIAVFFEPAVHHGALFKTLDKYSFTVHLWNGLITPQLPYIAPGTVLSALLEATCPMTYQSDLKYMNTSATDKEWKELGIVNTNTIVKPFTSFIIKSPKLATNYEHGTPDVEIQFDNNISHAAIAQYKFCYALKEGAQFVREITCKKIETDNSRLMKFQFFEQESQQVGLASGKYTFYGWLKDDVTNYVIGEPKLATFHMMFSAYKRDTQLQKLKSFMHAMKTMDKRRHSVAENVEYFNVIFLYEKMAYGEENTVDMPAFNFFESGLLPALARFNGRYKNISLKSWLYGPGHEGWSDNNTVQENLMSKFGSIINFDLLILLPPPWPDAYDKDTNPTSIPPSEIKNLSKIIPIAFRQAELTTNARVTNDRLNLINATFLFATYDLDRPIDVLLTGRLDPVVYPLRTRLYRLLDKHQAEFRIAIVSHPGYAMSYLNAKKHLKQYSNLMKQAKINLVTPSSYRFGVAKFAESQLAGNLIVGDVPDERETYFNSFVVRISMSDTDEKILSTLRWWLDHPKERHTKARMGYIYAFAGETWSGWIFSVMYALDEFNRVQKTSDRNDQLLKTSNNKVYLLSTVDGDGFRVFDGQKNNAKNNNDYGQMESRLFSTSLSMGRKITRGTNLQFVFTCGCKTVSNAGVQYLFDHSSNNFDVVDSVCSNRKVKSIILDDPDTVIPRHFFLCKQYPFSINYIAKNHLDLNSIYKTDVAINMFPGAFQLLYNLGINGDDGNRNLEKRERSSTPNESNTGRSSNIEIFVTITSIAPLRVWLFSKGIVFQNIQEGAESNARYVTSIFDIEKPNGKYSSWVKHILQKIKSLSFSLLEIENKCNKKCYQVLRIDMQILEYRHGETGALQIKNVSILNVDANPQVFVPNNKDETEKEVILLRKYLLTKLYDKTWKMKGIHPDTLYPSLLDTQLWLNYNGYCKIVDCSNHVKINTLISIFTEVYYGNDSFQLLWPTDLHRKNAVLATNINDYSKFTEEELELCNTMFYIFKDLKAKANSHAIHTLFDE